MSNSESSPTDIFGDDASFDELEAFEFGENQDEEDAQSGQEQEQQAPPTPDPLDVLAEELELSADGKESATPSKAYKGIQRTLAKRDREINELRAELSRREQADAQRWADNEDRLTMLGAGNDLIFDQFIQALEEEHRPNVQVAAFQKQEQARQQIAQRRAQQQNAQRAAQQQQAPMEPWQVELTQRIAAEQQQFAQVSRSLVQVAGFDPDTEGLDYGSPDETFNARLMKLNASLEKAKTSGVKAKAEGLRGAPLQTRGATGSQPATSPAGGRSNLDAGADEILANLRGRRKA